MPGQIVVGVAAVDVRRPAVAAMHVAAVMHVDVLLVVVVRPPVR